MEGTSCFLNTNESRIRILLPFFYSTDFYLLRVFQKLYITDIQSLGNLLQGFDGWIRSTSFYIRKIGIGNAYGFPQVFLRELSNFSIFTYIIADTNQTSTSYDINYTLLSK